MLKTEKWLEPWHLANGHSSESTQKELSNEYQHDRVKIVFKGFGVPELWTKVASALEGLKSKFTLHTFVLPPPKTDRVDRRDCFQFGLYLV